MIWHLILGVAQLALAAAMIFRRARTADVAMLWYVLGGLLAIDGVLQVVLAFS